MSNAERSGPAIAFPAIYNIDIDIARLEGFLQCSGYEPVRVLCRHPSAALWAIDLIFLSI